jgi:hypothetical protein
MTPKFHQEDTFSSNLVNSSKLHRCFLRNLHKYGITLSRPSHESFRRYSQLWLPFLARQYQQQRHNEIENEPSSFLLLDVVPPADIAWLWHCHRLAPYRYAKYIEKTFSKEENNPRVISQDEQSIMILESRFPFAFQMGDNADNETLLSYCNGKSGHDATSLAGISKRTQDAFAEMYPEESFFLSTTTEPQESRTNPDSSNTLLDGFDVNCILRTSSIVFVARFSGPNF